MALPPVHCLVGAAAAECVRAEHLPARRAWAAGAFVAALPDLDLPLALLAEIGGAAHGIYTHSLIATALITSIACLLLGRRWGAIVGSAWASHLVVDLFRGGTVTSVYLFWPLSRQSIPPLAPLFPTVPFEWQDAPGLLPELHGPQATWLLTQQTLTGLAIFLGTISVSSVIRRWGSAT